ncbi:hypothetical protein TRAPUB_5967 [Trametes pubescens]|uniref:Uncharacterized protein n=1 Tax=Trametes pubescens TaxID=154538 RepID=A0A1M2W721_TRAPU|nr:hypothetical protein TRAPUB_5967 [Trametes pubescens]
MSTNDDAAEQIPLVSYSHDAAFIISQRDHLQQDVGNLNALINAFLLARLIESMPDNDEEQGQPEAGPSNGGAVVPPPMRVPMVFPQPTRGQAPPMPQPFVANQSTAAHDASLATSLVPQPLVVPPPPPANSSASTPPVSAPPTAPAPPRAAPSVPVRPPSPDDVDVARTSIAWRLFTAPLYSRLAEALFENKDSLPEPTTGNICYLKLDGYGARNSVENMCALVTYLDQRPWEDQLVDRFVEERKATPHWPAKLQDKPHADHLKYVWLLMDGLLCVIGLSLSLVPAPPPTFAGAVNMVFPPVPEGVKKPKRFTFSARELIEEDFIIQPTPIMLDHLKLNGNAVSVYVLSTAQITLLLGYDRNKVARAIGMADYGHEIMQSYGALVKEEFREKYQLPISLGMIEIDDERARRGQYDDLTVVSSIIEKKHKDPKPYHPPQLLAGRVHIIETELRRRRHWYRRLLRDIHKRKKGEPWMFWGAVLAVFFGICTVIQTITSVWSLVVSVSN